MDPTDERRASRLRGANREKVARNEVRVSTLWAEPLVAYNVQIELDPNTRGALGEIQRDIAAAEPDLLATPPGALHVSVAWLLAAHVEYPVSEEVLWEHHGEAWISELTRIAARTRRFRLAYTDVVATDSAVILLARPVEPVNAIREAIRERLELPPQTRHEADLVHTTLFRYSSGLSDPRAFLTLLENIPVDVTAEVDSLIVSKELVYPSLETEVLARLPLA